MPKPILCDLAAVQLHKGGFGPADADFAYGELALDVIGHATAAELFSAFRGRLPENTLEVSVGILLDAGLTYDAVIEGEIPDAR